MSLLRSLDSHRGCVNTLQVSSMKICLNKREMWCNLPSNFVITSTNFSHFFSGVRRVNGFYQDQMITGLLLPSRIPQKFVQILLHLIVQIYSLQNFSLGHQIEKLFPVMEMESYFTLVRQILRFYDFFCY